MLLNNGVRTGAATGPKAGAAHMMPTITVVSAPIAPSPFSNSAP